jgi:hypothetical protein
MENKEIFRKKAVDRVASPEQLNDYIHVTSPAIWMALIGIILILAGGIVWATYGSIYTTVEGAGTVSDGNLMLYIKVADQAEVEEGMTITVGGQKTAVRSISAEPVQITDGISDYILNTTGLKTGDWAYVVEADTDLRDGVYSASITVESIHPIKFVIN